MKGHGHQMIPEVTNSSLANRVVLTTAIVAVLMSAPFLKAQSKAAPRPQFEVASIKACDAVGAAPSGQRDGKLNDPAASSPGRLTLPCARLRVLIQMAYDNFANGQYNSTRLLSSRIEGVPAAADSERYAITAKAEGNASQIMMRGAMLQALLEDRFKLKVHRETREGPIFELNVAKSGTKMKRTVEGSCIPRDPMQYPQDPKGPGEKPWCFTINVVSSRSTMSTVFDAVGTTMAELALRLPGPEQRPIVDKTGLTGMFDFHLEFLRNGGPPPEDPDPAHAAPSIFTAIGALGLKLESSKGPVEFLVVDHVEKPSEN
jgi:uncharacterized protein (TIGR03435 family)